ncbi:hypothetical protein ACIBCT_37480 [Streptosporangium sp. NPDC050855]|uniref:hypothetical protein n=1 Tax=Streptosporangium sp. NPDC050855 TaxID=3366194 RepID=UPI003798B95B
MTVPRKPDSRSQRSHFLTALSFSPVRRMISARVGIEVHTRSVTSLRRARHISTRATAHTLRQPSARNAARSGWACTARSHTR